MNRHHSAHHIDQVPGWEQAPGLGAGRIEEGRMVGAAMPGTRSGYTCSRTRLIASALGEIGLLRPTLYEELLQMRR